MRLPGRYDAPTGTATASIPFDNWARQMRDLASLSNTYMKLSGGFSQIDPLPLQQEQTDFWTRAELMDKTRGWMMQWMDVVLAEFGPRRIMFGSDWPVCNLGGGGNDVAWMNVS